MQRIKHAIDLITLNKVESVPKEEAVHLVRTEVEVVNNCYIESMSKVDETMRSIMHETKNHVVQLRMNVDKIASRKKTVFKPEHDELLELRKHRKYFSEIQNLIRDRINEYIIG